MLLAIDPGQDTGWATFLDGQLSSCGLGPPPVLRATCVVIEKPQVYRGRASKGDPNDLISLAILVGQYTERYASRGVPVDHVIPHTWKGSLPPGVCLSRIVEALTWSERAVLDTVISPLARKPLGPDTLEEGKRHNVIDAVGIGLWSMKRSRAGVFR